MQFARTVCRLDQQMVGTEGLFSVRCTHNDFSLGMGEQVLEQVGVSPPWSPLCVHPPALVEEMRSLDEVHCFQSEALAPFVQVPLEKVDPVLFRTASCFRSSVGIGVY